MTFRTERSLARVALNCSTDDTEAGRISNSRAALSLSPSSSSSSSSSSLLSSPLLLTTIELCFRRIQPYCSCGFGPIASGSADLQLPVLFPECRRHLFSYFEMLSIERLFRPVGAGVDAVACGGEDTWKIVGRTVSGVAAAAACILDSEAWMALDREIHPCIESELDR